MHISNGERRSHVARIKQTDYRFIGVVVGTPRGALRPDRLATAFTHSLFVSRSRTLDGRAEDHGCCGHQTEGNVESFHRQRDHARSLSRKSPAWRTHHLDDNRERSRSDQVKANI